PEQTMAVSMKALTGSLALTLASTAFAAPPSVTVQTVLAANRAAVGAAPAKGTLNLEFSLETSGLTGTATHANDVTTGAFVDRYDLSVISGANGYDGRTPWQTEVSGVSTDQEEGDRVPVAVNEAYRNGNRWWRPDRGGAAIRYIGRESLDGRSADHL